MLKEIIIAIQSYFQAHRFIVKNKLWKWILIPGAIYTILFMVGMYYFWHSSGAAIDYFFSHTGLKAWLQKQEDSWLRFLFIFGQLILHLILMLFYFSWFKYLFLIIGSPVFAFLSEKTEALLTGSDASFSILQYIRDVARGVSIAVRNTLWQSVYSLSILILSLIPVVGWGTPVLALLVECYYFGFSMLDYTSERKHLSASESIDYIGHHKGLAIGNGMVFYMMHGVFIIGWLLAPSYAVIAATLSVHNLKNSQQ